MSMAARSLVQALEGVQFPCDRTRLIEYARRQEASPRSMDALRALPDRQFRDMTELFSALPSKHDLRRRSTVIPMQASEENRPPENGKTDEFTEEAVPPPLAAPLDCADDEPCPDQLDPMGEWWRLWAQMGQEWLRMVQRFWFPWCR
jgi:hypothetical protein